ncbi:MarR family transcriptional regulator [Limosilactobacillus gastricus]|uniref:Transcriptional regulator n=1 Tax=Limosilactobacillus gastricus DSM 16045 TaxID=1423749 RepID=A0A0R1VED1_9LACO|nr:MarR family transcriptional regulator [Limosilactobacillus gastricus]KRM03711.1 Transcriptional regulator [Limosilactobacillus gastricus DSM 16045]QGF39893.1 MarR family transcriptional regulator [Limosilactobacillus gastricus]
MKNDDYREIAQALTRVNTAITWIEEQELRKSRFNDLTLKELHAIDAITMYDQPTASVLAERLHVAPGTATATIDRLCRKGYAQRLPDQHDRRVIRITLTKKGRLIYRTQRAFHDRLANSFLKDVDDDQLGVIKKSLANLEDFLNVNLR